MNTSHPRRLSVAVLIWFLLGSCFVLSSAWFVLRVSVTGSHDSTPEHDRAIATDPSVMLIDKELMTWPLLDLAQYQKIPVHSLSVVVPVTPESLSSLSTTLSPFLNPSLYVKEITVVCHRSAISSVRQSLRRIVVGKENIKHPDLSLRPWSGILGANRVVLCAAADVSTEWVLVLDEKGFDGIPLCMQHMLLNPFAALMPVGPRGMPRISLHASDGQALPASYLFPPFVMPTLLATQIQSIDNIDVWSDFGRLVATIRNDSTGGIIVLHKHLDCKDKSSLASLDGNGSENRSQYEEQNDPARSLAEVALPYTFDPIANGAFAFILPNYDLLSRFGSLICGLKKRNRLLRILLYSEPSREVSYCHGKIWNRQLISFNLCSASYDVLCEQFEFPGNRPLVSNQSSILEWIKADVQSDIVIYVAKESYEWLAFLFPNGLLVHIPDKDLVYAGWMASLSLEEWRKWNIPHVDISIITKDRPASLKRLLASLESGIYFGDSVNLRINLEQNCDAVTRDTVKTYEWLHGSVFVHHRVILGGLLVAVVESWYPQNNDVYGLLLEDDIEVSPLFYAWIKMSLLRYRYGDPANRSNKLFGISLYQPKNIELPPEGRQPFNARTLFAHHGLPHINSPYLSPIPCSWGAVYFPEHWKEFHEYVMLRFSEILMPLDRNVVANVRSNNWTKSWKKYFIELVYLRGYVMLYPNYDGFLSLSTNHLEVGSHVKIRTKEKQDLFRLPLMPLSNSTLPSFSDLLQLPEGRLPIWRDLPVLNLTGVATDLQTLEDSGYLRWKNLTGCSGVDIDVVSSGKKTSILCASTMDNP